MTEHTPPAPSPIFTGVSDLIAYLESASGDFDEKERIVKAINAYDSFRALNAELREGLERGLERMRLINGNDGNCCMNSPGECPNHSWINYVQALLRGAKE